MTLQKSWKAKLDRALSSMFQYCKITVWIVFQAMSDMNTRTEIAYKQNPIFDESSYSRFFYQKLLHNSMTLSNYQKALFTLENRFQIFMIRKFEKILVMLIAHPAIYLPVTRFEGALFSIPLSFQEIFQKTFIFNDHQYLVKVKVLQHISCLFTLFKNKSYGNNCCQKCTGCT